MKLICARVPLFFIVFFFAALARADVIVDNFSQPTLGYYGPIGDDADSSDFLIGQEFTFAPEPSPYQINEITLLLSASSSANITVSLWNVDGNNNPSNEIAVLPSVKVAKAGQFSFVPTNNIILEPGMYYVVAAPTTPADSGLVYWAYPSSYNADGSGAFNSYAFNTSGSWRNTNNGLQQMSLQATVVAASFNGIARKTNVTTLSWPSFLGGFVADSTTNLVKPVWQTIANTPALGGGTNIVTNVWGGPMQFYRLRQSWVVNNLAQPGFGWNGPIGSDNNAGDFRVAQEFTLLGGTNLLTQVTLGLIPVNGSGAVTVSIWSVGSDGNPGTQMATVGSELVSRPADVAFTPSTAIELPAGSYYVVATSTTQSDNGKVGWYYTQSFGWVGFGTLGNEAATPSGNWEYYSFGDAYLCQMSVQVTPVP
jgi:hypothetical protein